MSDSQLFEDEVLERVREFGPVVPTDVLSSTGPSAQRVLAHVLATSARTSAADGQREPPGFSTVPAPGSTWLTGRRVGALASVAAVIVIVVVILVIGGGGRGGSSIVGRAYAATDPVGVIVHYVETSRSTLHAPGHGTVVDEFWTYGQQTHEIIDAGSRRYRQDIVTGGGQVQTLASRRLAIIPAWPLNTRCAPAIVLLGGCAEGQNNLPIDALRSLLHAGRIHATGRGTLNGRHVDVLSGTSGDLRVRATVDARTFLPVKVSMTETFPQSRGVRPIIDTYTITGYQRLPVTPNNRQLLALPAHPNVPVIRFHSCPTNTNPYRLCR